MWNFFISEDNFLLGNFAVLLESGEWEGKHLRFGFFEFKEDVFEGLIIKTSEVKAGKSLLRIEKNFKMSGQCSRKSKFFLEAFHKLFIFNQPSFDHKNFFQIKTSLNSPFRQITAL